MNSQKSLLAKIIETIDQHRAERRTVAPPQEQRFSQQSRFVRWLPTPGNVLFTLLVAGLLVMTQHVWATSRLASVPGASATTVNYQGRLENSSGNPLSGTQNLEFAIYDTDTGGNPIWGPESHTNVSVNDGLFSVGLGSQTAGGIPTTTWDGDRYLEITVNGETLTPRELIRSVPIAGMALTVPDGTITSQKVVLSSGQFRGTEDLRPTTSGQILPGVDFTLDVTTNQIMLVYATIDAMTSASSGTIVGYILVDGVSYGTPATVGLPGQVQRSSAAAVAYVPLAPGSHTVKLAVHSESDSGGIVFGGNSGITYFLFSQ